MKTVVKKAEYPPMPLGLLVTGEKAEIIELRGQQFQNSCRVPTGKQTGCTEGCRVEEMGLRPGKIVQVLNNDGRALLIKIDETRIALAKGMALKVMVRRTA